MRTSIMEAIIILFPKHPREMPELCITMWWCIYSQYNAVGNGNSIKGFT